MARGSDTVARVGNNEFVICAERLGNDLEAVAIADRWLLALKQPFEIGDEEIRVGQATAGIAVSSGGDGPETPPANASAARRAALEH